MNAIYYALIALFWGGSFVAIRHSVDALPPLFAASFRMIFSLTLLSIIYLATDKPFRVPGKLRARVWLAGFFAQGLPFSLLFWGEKIISPGLAGILNGTVPIFTFLFGLAFLRSHEPFSGRKLAGIGSGLIGIVWIFWPGLTGLSTGRELLATLAVAGMAVSYSIGGLMNRVILSRDERPDFYANIFEQAFASALYLGAMSLLIEGVPRWPDLLSHAHGRLPSAVGALIYLGWCSTALAFLMYYRLLAKWGAVRASSVTYVVPAIAILIAFVVDGDLPKSNELIGAGFILAGILMVQFPSLRSKASSITAAGRLPLGARIRKRLSRTRGLNEPESVSTGTRGR